MPSSCDIVTFTAQLCCADNGSTVNHQSPALLVTQHCGCQGDCVRHETASRIPEMSDTIDYLVDGNGVTDLTTCQHLRAWEERLTGPAVYHTPLSLLNRGTDNLSLTDEVAVN